jgi:hypothetical protein
LWRNKLAICSTRSRQFAHEPIGNLFYKEEVTMTNKFLELLSSQTILADGAMGTMLHGRGIGFDKCFDELNLTNPAAVADIHREYIEAGAQMVITNTFGDGIPCGGHQPCGRGISKTGGVCLV